MLNIYKEDVYIYEIVENSLLRLKKLFEEAKTADTE